MPSLCKYCGKPYCYSNCKEGFRERDKARHAEKRKDPEAYKLKVSMAAKRRQRRLKQRVLPGDDVSKVYEQCAKMNKEAGFSGENMARSPFVVDHIVPLNGENVCGLHVSYNLQITTRVENGNKGNQHD